jgi:HEAT repeat protein
MDQDLIDRFRESMVMNYERWHDGLGYDIELLDEMSETERKSIEALLIANVSNWRDLEALDRLGTPESLDAIAKARESSNTELRLAAQQYGVKPTAEERESAILDGLADDGTLSKALDEAAENPTPKIIAALLKMARDRDGVAGYHAASTLYYVHGKMDSPYDMTHRPFFLRFSEPPSPDRRLAFEELCRQLKIDPAHLS